MEHETTVRRRRLPHWDVSGAVYFVTTCLEGSIWAYVVMPSHMHWVFRARDECVASLAAEAKRRSPRERIMHTLKLRTALECNKARGETGTFWQDESYDHCVRDEEELGRIVEYVELNPVRAGLVATPEAWQFSIAAERKQKGLSYLAPLAR